MRSFTNVKFDCVGLPIKQDDGSGGVGAWEFSILTSS